MSFLSTNIQLSILTLGTAAGAAFLPKLTKSGSQQPPVQEQAQSPAAGKEDDFDLEKFIK